jgi:sarcosine oxidase/L-pipecolate oxidase
MFGQEFAIFSASVADSQSLFVFLVFQSLAAKFPNCEMRDNTELLAVEDYGMANGLGLVTSKGTFHSKKMVLCPGPFVSHVTKRLFNVVVPVTTIKITVPYFRSLRPEEFNYNGTKRSMSDCRTPFPYVIFYGQRNNHMYALPAIEYPDLLKFCWHEGPEMNPLKNDHTPDYTTLKEELVPVLDGSMTGPFQFHGLDPKPVTVDTCIYSNTPDKDFILDYLLPGDDRIVLGAGFSGQGFKFGPAIGEILADLVGPKAKGPGVKSRPGDVGLDFFALRRFRDSGEGEAKL